MRSNPYELNPFHLIALSGTLQLDPGIGILNRIFEMYAGASNKQMNSHNMTLLLLFALEINHSVWEVLIAKK